MIGIADQPSGGQKDDKLRDCEADQAQCQEDGVDELLGGRFQRADALGGADDARETGEYCQTATPDAAANLEENNALQCSRFLGARSFAA